MAGYTVNITEVQNVVTATSSVNNITITSDNNPDITIDENSFVFTATSVLSTVTIYTDAVELLVDDFANYFRGDWISGATYRRGELVNDRYSLFVCSTGTLTTVTSTINPSDYTNTLSWTRVVWNEAPRSHLTVTNYLDVGTTATISGLLSARGLVTISTSGSRPVGPAGADTTSLLTNDGMTWLAGNTAIGNRNFPLEAPQPPTANRTYSLVVYGNQLITSSTFIGGNLSVTGLSGFQDVGIGKSITVNQNLNVLGVTTSGNLVVTNTASILGSLSVGDITGNGGLTVAGPLRVNGISTFTNSVNFLGTATFNNDVVFVKDLTVPNLTATNSLRVASVLYPVTTGSFGQVIANMGDYTAQWRNLGDLVFWSLSDDLRTNGFDIVSGSSSTQLTIGNGPVTGTPQGYLKFDDNKIDIKTTGALTIEAGRPVDGGDIDISTAFGDVYLTASRVKSLDLYGGAIYLRTEGYLEFDSSSVNFSSANVEFGSTGNATFKNGLFVQTGNARFSTSTQGIQFGDGTIQRTASTSTISTTATSTRLGGVKIGSGISITADGTISADGGGGGGSESIVAAGTGTAVYSSVSGSTTTYTVALTTASGATLGGVRVGSGLAIDGDGVLSTTATSTPASRSQLGAVIIGSGINVTTTGSISVPKASPSILGSIRVGDNLSIDGDGILSASAVINTGTFSLSSDAKSNHFKITDDSTENYIRLDGPGGIHDVSLVAGASTGSVLISAARNIQITAANTATISAGQINLSSTATTIIGSGVNTSELRVQKIYNYAGTYAPFFPAGIQLADQTVQITAYHPDGGPLPAV